MLAEEDLPQNCSLSSDLHFLTTRLSSSFTVQVLPAKVAITEGVIEQSPPVPWPQDPGFFQEDAALPVSFAPGTGNSTDIGAMDLESI